MSTTVKRYRLISPESFDRLSSMMTSTTVNVRKSKSRSPSPDKSDWRDILLMLPKHYRRNTQMIMSYLARLPDDVFKIQPGTMEIAIDGRSIVGSNFVELIYSLHNNLPKHKSRRYPVGLTNFLYLIASATAAPIFIVQNAKLRDMLKSIRLMK